MRQLFIITLIILLATPATFAQTYVYVNTNNLILRDRPERKYNVLAVLQPGCRLEIKKNNNGYQNDKAANARFYQVSYTKRDTEKHTSNTIFGWVEKKYVKTTVPLSTAQPIIKLVLYDRHQRSFNCTQFPYPKYKGGEAHFVTTAKRKFITGARGGCYYLAPNGKKRYVDPSLCK